MKSASIFLPVLSALALSSCAPSDDEGEETAPLPFPPFELAKAKGAGEASQTPSAPKVVDLTVEQVRAKLEAGTIRLIDVRTDGEVAKGMISGAEHIAMGEFDPARLDMSDKRDIVLYCRSGRRSRIVGQKLSAYTGQPVSHLAGGIIAWRGEAGDR